MTKRLEVVKNRYILLLLAHELNDVASSRVVGKGIRSFLSSLLSIFLWVNVPKVSKFTESEGMNEKSMINDNNFNFLLL